MVGPPTEIDACQRARLDSRWLDPGRARESYSPALLPPFACSHPRELPDQRQGELRMRADHLLQAILRDHDQRDRLEGDRRRRMGRGPEEGDFPEQVAKPMKRIPAVRRMVFPFILTLEPIGDGAD